MCDTDAEIALQAAADTFIDAEGVRREALQRHAFHEVANLVMDFRQQMADLASADAAALASMSEEERAAVLAARKPNDKDAEARAELEQEEDLYGRRVLLLEEEEALARLMVTFTAIDLAISIDAAFKWCIRRRYDHSHGTVDFELLPMPAHALDRVGRHRERHLPDFYRMEHIEQQPHYIALIDAEHKASFDAAMETLAIEPPKQEPPQAPVDAIAAPPEQLRITA